MTRTPSIPTKTTLCRICDFSEATEVCIGNPRNPSSTSTQTFDACKECAGEFEHASNNGDDNEDD